MPTDPRSFGFGRAHHRVLHFVDRNPGLTVAELLDILKITKQSLGRVLKELSTRASSSSARARRTGASACSSTYREGQALARDLALCNPGASRRALGELGPAGHAVASALPLRIVDRPSAQRVERLVRVAKPR